MKSKIAHSRALITELSSTREELKLIKQDMRNQVWKLRERVASKQRLPLKTCLCLRKSRPALLQYGARMPSHATSLLRIAYLMSAAVLVRPSWRMTSYLCDSAVRAEIPIKAAASFIVFPSASNCTTSLWRDVSGVSRDGAFGSVVISIEIRSSASWGVI